VSRKWELSLSLYRPQVCGKLIKLKSLRFVENWSNWKVLLLIFLPLIFLPNCKAWLLFIHHFNISFWWHKPGKFRIISLGSCNVSLRYMLSIPYITNIYFKNLNFNFSINKLTRFSRQIFYIKFLNMCSCQHFSFVLFYRENNHLDF